ncbi:hypothetical protein HMPREF9629_00465 [Peptoanaerobacter stomatis]|uniref:TNase-like domain-containing protein n=1 Tax=Peptoanaerobacter stomatis TaxID=796937 RepID=G9X242_9FIRM|nr:thermonuclease family protein [Peptoanaerobacter stomatis]EHL13165.1 hypothetical protein HMPREF9629_00465 [Peptoanaerobacter stomatis]
MKKLLTALLSATLLFTSLPTLHNTYAEVSKTITKEIDLTKQYEVTNIFDGDTIAIKIDGEEQRIRLLQIDTPEVNHKDIKKSIPMALKATEFTSNFVKDKKITLEFDKEQKDQYGRWLAYVYVDGKCLNEELVKKGFAKVVKYGENTKKYDDYKKIEKELREKKIGIWKDIKANYPSNNKSQQNTKQQSNTQKTTQANNTKAVTKTDNASNTNTAQGKIKGNKKTKVYHVPSGAYYNKVSDENAVYFDTEEDAKKAGYRASER